MSQPRSLPPASRSAASRPAGSRPAAHAPATPATAAPERRSRAKPDNPLAQPPAAPNAQAAQAGDDQFAALPLSPDTLATLEQLGYLRMTPIQAATLPLALAGNDIVAQARTGSGKTVAFGLVALQRLNPRQFAPQSLVLCPTRELADQVAKEIRRLARGADNIKVLTLCGGVPMGPQIGSLEHGAHVLVATPGRLIDHLQRRTVDLEAIGTLVLDEADRMLDMGFHDALVEIARACPRRRQTLLFSATYPDDLDQISRNFQRSPITVRVDTAQPPAQIEQTLFAIDEGQRLEAVAWLLRAHRPARVLAFCNTRAQCVRVAEHLVSQGFDAHALHGELRQRERDQVLIRFANNSSSVLVATDVAARGIDLDELPAVLNVDLSPDPHVHVHRIGRTGRAGHSGWAASLASARDQGRVAGIEKLAGARLARGQFDLKTKVDRSPLIAPMITLQLQAGRKNKLRPGDVLGALTGDLGYTRDDVGQIDVREFDSYVAIRREVADEVLLKINQGTIKGRNVRARLLDIAAIGRDWPPGDRSGVAK